MGDLWCLVGDFNTVTNSKERKGITERINNMEIEEFNKFIAEMELVDPQLLERRFTWYKPDVMTMSKLDRFLLSENWVNLGGGGLLRNGF